MDMKHSSLGQAAEFTSISKNILFGHRSVFIPIFESERANVNSFN